MIVKTVAGVLTVLLVANMVLYALNLVSGLVFWVVLTLIALFAYFGLPWMRSRFGKQPK